MSWHRRHRHWHHGHDHHGRDCGCVPPFYGHFHPGGARFPWDRVIGEARERRPGWRGRIRQELRLHYGAHLHRRLFHWFGAAIFLSVGTTILASHLGRSWLAAHPGRAVFLFGFPTMLLWTATERIARRISRPIYELTRAAQELGQGNLTARASLGHGSIDEMGVLSSAFNDMAVQLERKLTEQRELLAAVSHELRTPLARIRLLVEIARQSRPTPATLDDIEREAIEIDTLVGELLASARLEFQAVTRKPLEAGETARRAIERAGEDAGKLALPAAPLPFVADPTLVARALANLIDNARKHGGGLDGMAVRGGDGTVVFEIRDRGPGFAAGDEERVFDRFYRGNGDAGHHGSLGLGLALVRRIAVAHGGRAAASNRSDGGARVTLELPLDLQAPPAPPA
ncbi:MAG TPA: HAMP domain-containing sensor histidine kinase [Polyangia bacterium]|nr:HAMP domain-containing sensor histidine kinase [Polyangia bacterium]